MNNVRLIAELGSCHMGKLDRIIEAIDRCKTAGIDALKLQLFPNKAPYVPVNIYLPGDMFAKAFEYGQSVGLPVSASVFTLNDCNFLCQFKPDFIKFAFSKKDQVANYLENIFDGTEIIASADVMTVDNLSSFVDTKLYCIPEYPVRYEVAFDGLFPRFDGFSDHTLGVRQTRRAIEAGAQVIEKHVRLGYDDETCPDARFAVTIEEFASVRK